MLSIQQNLDVLRPKIIIIGSRGVPPKYGGAETFVYELSKRMKDAFEVYVICETNRFGIDDFEGIKRIHIWSYHTSTITIPSIYDVVATVYALKKVKDAHLFYYVTPDGALAAMLARLARRKVIINTDGIEWRRLLKRARYVYWYLKPLYLITAVYMLIMEFLACKIPHVTIADSLAIKKYLARTWRPKRVTYIAYGIRTLPDVEDGRVKEIMHKLGLEPYGYFLTVGRIVAENNIHLEIEAFKRTSINKKLVIVGPIDSRDPYIKFLFKLSEGDRRIILTGSIYDVETLHTLRKYCLAYIHPYTVGGTNPSLLEQLQYNRPIIAYDVSFHREILKDKGLYFRTVEELTSILRDIHENNLNIDCCYKSQLEKFSWDVISKQYFDLFKRILNKKNDENKNTSH